MFRRYRPTIRKPRIRAHSYRVEPENQLGATVVGRVGSKTGLAASSSLFSAFSALMKNNDGSILYDHFLAFNRRLRVIIQRLHPPLDLVETHLLGEIDQQRIINSTALLETLRIEKTKVSRTIAYFLEKKWIEARQSQSDRRVRYFTITPAGKEIFMADNHFRNLQVRECLSPLSHSEQKDLVNFINRMADALGTSQIVSLPGDVVGKMEIRRLTRAIGLLGDNLLDLGLPLDECQLLHMVHRDGNRMSMSTLKIIMPWEMTLISRLTTSLAERGLLKKVPLPYDKRHVQVVLTTEGTARAQKNLQHGGKRLLGALTQFSPPARTQFFTLLEKMLAHNLEAPNSEESKKMVVQEITGEESIKTARAFLVETLVAQKRSHEIGASILHPQNISYQLTNLGAIRAVCELEVRNQDVSLLYFVAPPDLNDLPALRHLFAAALDRALSASGTERLNLKDNGQLPPSLQNAVNAAKNGEISRQFVSDLSSRN